MGEGEVRYRRYSSLSTPPSPPPPLPPPSLTRSLARSLKHSVPLSLQPINLARKQLLGLNKVIHTPIPAIAKSVKV